MITKRKRLGTVHVKFAWESSEEVSLAGSFNGWEPEPMKQGKDGVATATVKVPAGERLEFRYVDGQGNWFDDPEAEEHVENEHGSTNGVVHT